MSVNHNIRVTSAELFTGKQQLYSTPKACSALAEKKKHTAMTTLGQGQNIQHVLLVSNRRQTSLHV